MTRASNSKRYSTAWFKSFSVSLAASVGQIIRDDNNWKIKLCCDVDLKALNLETLKSVAQYITDVWNSNPANPNPNHLKS